MNTVLWEHVLCSLRFSWAQPSLALLFFCKTTDTTESLLCMTLLLGTSVDTCSLCQQGRSVCPASCWIKTSEEGVVPKPGFGGHGTLQYSTATPAVLQTSGWCWSHWSGDIDTKGWVGCASWLLPAFPDCGCLSLRSEKGCGGNKRADEHLFLFFSSLDWQPAAFLLPDHLGYCDESSPLFFASTVSPVPLSLWNIWAEE